MQKKFTTAIITIFLILAMTICGCGNTTDIVKDPSIEVSDPDTDDSEKNNEEAKNDTDTEDKAVEDKAEEDKAESKDAEADKEAQITEISLEKYAQTKLNVRSGPSTEHEKLGTLKLNQKVKVTGKTEDGWYRILFGDTEAFVNGKYLGDSKVIVNTVAKSEPTEEKTGQTVSGNNGNSGNSGNSANNNGNTGNSGSSGNAGNSGNTGNNTGNENNGNDGNTEETPDLSTPEKALAYVDAKANERKTKILSSANTVDPATYEGTVYYVSPNGSDDNDGKSPEKAWATLEKVNTEALGKGSAVLFERGGLWRGALKTQEGVTYSSYGSGEKPAIYGSPENGAAAEKWTLHAQNGEAKIWVYNRDLNDVGSIVLNDGESWGKRVYFSYKDGEYYKYNSLKEESKLDFTTCSFMDENLKFFSAANSKIGSNGLPVFGGDQENVGKLYFRCDAGNPGEVYESIEFCTLPKTIQKNTYGNIVSLNQNVTIDNLTVKYGGCHGIAGAILNGINITNCEVGWIGGTVQFVNASGTQKTTAYGNAIEFTKNCENVYVNNNWVYQCYDTGITNQHNAKTGGVNVHDIEYSDNLIEYCDMSFEIWHGGTDESIADGVKMKNLLLENNICRYAGYGFSVQRPNYTVGAHISAAWGGTGTKNNAAENYVIRNNVFDRTNGDIQLLWMTAGKEEWLPTLENNLLIQNEGYKLGRLDTKSEEEQQSSWCEVFSKYNATEEEFAAYNTAIKNTNGTYVIVPLS